MPAYSAPVQEMAFVIDELAAAETAVGGLDNYQEYGVGPELTTAVLDEAGKLAGEVLAPLRPLGDKEPAVCKDRKIILTPGFTEAWSKMAEGGWQGISIPAEHGGQGLPEIYGSAAFEMWSAANMAFGLGPLLTAGAALAIAAHGTEQQQALYLEKMNSGEWSGTMNLTESGAGSDLSVLKARAVPDGDHYRLFGQKIYITWGDHEATSNIIHLVLARLPDAPAGSGGISLFIVPKYVLDEDGNPGERNDVYPVSTEHKLGIHGSPTCVMAFGDTDGAIGYLLGPAHQGLRCMFTMMNEARLKVGLQGLGIAEGATQKALGYARDRVQGGRPILEHPDVLRMIYTMKSLTEAMRAIGYVESVTLDQSHYAEDAAARESAQMRVDLMIPIIKGWMTEIGNEVASLGVQVHGGMGYIEETGAAQYLRDVRIAAIYEGTNGIQAADLVGRKISRDGGSLLDSLLDRADASAVEARACGDNRMVTMGAAIERATAGLRSSVAITVERGTTAAGHALLGSFDLMMQAGYVLGGWQLLRSALLCQQHIANGSASDFHYNKIVTAEFYCSHVLTRAQAHGNSVENAVEGFLTEGLVGL